MTVMRSENVLIQDIYVNSTSAVPRKGTNTDGANTMYVNDITFRRWTVSNGDDGISIKANSTRVTVEDSTFHGGAVALGSIGQYFGVYEVIEDIMIRNISYYGGWAPLYGKTWTGKKKGIPPNGGGGGIGHIKNVSKSFTVPCTSRSNAVKRRQTYTYQERLSSSPSANAYTGTPAASPATATRHSSRSKISISPTSPDILAGFWI